MSLMKDNLDSLTAFMLREARENVHIDPMTREKAVVRSRPSSLWRKPIPESPPSETVNEKTEEIFHDAYRFKKRYKLATYSQVYDRTTQDGRDNIKGLETEVKRHIRQTDLVYCFGDKNPFRLEMAKRYDGLNFDSYTEENMGIALRLGNDLGRRLGYLEAARDIVRLESAPWQYEEAINESLKELKSNLAKIKQYLGVGVEVLLSNRYGGDVSQALQPMNKNDRGLEKRVA